MLEFLNILFKSKTKSPENYSVFENPYRSYENMIPFDGEKTPYEMGSPISYYIDYYSIRARSWQAYLESDVLQNAIRKYLLWIVGPGLKIQYSPVEDVIGESNDIFTNRIESFFRLYAKQKNCSRSLEWNLHKTAIEALKNAIISGDVLCVNRYSQKTGLNIEMIDGYYIQTPVASKYMDEAVKRGNTIEYGIELDKRKRHIAYYVRNNDYTYSRIPARKNRMRYAWLFYGLNYKKDTVRGMSLLTAILETASKMDRYKDATLSTAEENAKIPYTIEHSQFSTGENPMINQLAQSMGKGKGVAPETESYETCEPMATKIAQTTSKQTYNMPIGSSLKRNEFKLDLNFIDFFDKNEDVVYSTFGIPPEVAKDKFGGSYSSSRASLKSWEYKIETDRETMVSDQFYRPFFDLWLHIEILSDRIKNNSYVKAFFESNYMVLAAFRNCRFIGTRVPHIDPYKEVNAERLKLGEKFKDVPLTTAEQSCELLNSGDFENIIKKTDKEKDIAEDYINKEE